MRVPKSVSLVLFTLALVAGITAGCGSSSQSASDPGQEASSSSTAPKEVASGKTIELIMNFAEPEAHPKWEGMIKPWLQEIEAKTNNRVKFITYFGESLTNEGNVFEGVKTGLSDLGQMFTDANPGQFPLTEWLLIPGVGHAESVKNTPSIWKMITELPEVQKEWDGVKVLCVWGGPSQKLLSKKKISSTEDTPGVKTIVWSGAHADAAKAIGLTPVNVSMADMYMSIDKGVADAVIGSYQMAVATQVASLTTYGSDYVWSASTFYIVMNQSTYDGLPDDVRQVFDELSGEALALKFAETVDRIEGERAKAFLEEGSGDIVELTPDERAKWEEKHANIAQQEVDKLEKKGLPAQKVFDFFTSNLPQR